MKASPVSLAVFASCLLALQAPGASQNPHVYRQMCDASAAVWLNTTSFAAANDEDNVLRVYELENPLPTFTLDVSGFLQVDPKEPEADLEGAAKIEDLVFWIGSHGRNKNGKDRPSRRKFFATRIVSADGQARLVPAGQPYSHLLRDLCNDTRLSAYNLLTASKRAPKEQDALNIEGLAVAPDGSLLIGFRNPLPVSKALIVPLLNPVEVIGGSPAKLGNPILLNLGGKGIRSLAESKPGFLIIAGAYGEGGESSIYSWEPSKAPERLPFIFEKLNPEGLAIQAATALLISDDGTKIIGSKPCKELKDASLRQFRAMVTPLPQSIRTR